VLIAVWYLGLTAAALAFAFRDGGVRRATGAFIIGAYLVFLGSLLASAHAAAPGPGLTVVPLLVTGLAGVAALARRPGRQRGRLDEAARLGQRGLGGQRGQLGRLGRPGQPGEDPPAGVSTTSDESRS
jgi:hypothetical protein